MIEQIKTFQSNILALEIINDFSETDEKIAQKFFKEKLDLGFKTVNILIKVDEYNFSKTEVKAFFEDLLFLFRKFENVGNLAIVGHSNVLKTLVPMDNFFFEMLKNDKREQYFDISQMDEAFAFITNN